MRIIMTGTPGTGKTKVAEALSGKTGIVLVDIKEFVNENRLFKKEGETKSVDIPRLRGRLLPRLSRLKDYIVEGHLACEFRIPADSVFVLRTHPKKLRSRLAKRGYKKTKLDENLEAEMLDYCVQRVQKTYRITPLELDTTKRSVAECVRIMLDAIKQKKKKLDSVDYSHELEEHLRLR
jgi:adenylate kinase